MGLQTEEGSGLANHRRGGGPYVTQEASREPKGVQEMLIHLQFARQGIGVEHLSIHKANGGAIHAWF